MDGQTAELFYLCTLSKREINVLLAPKEHLMGRLVLSLCLKEISPLVCVCGASSCSR